METKKSDFKTMAKFGVPITALFLVFMINALNPFSGLDNKWWDFKFWSAGTVYKIVTGNDDYLGFYGKYLYRKADEKIMLAAIDEATTKKYGWPLKRRYYASLFDRLDSMGAKVIAMDIFLMDPDRDNPENDRVMIGGMKKHDNIINLVYMARPDLKIQLPINGVIQASRYIAQPHSDVAIDPDGHIRVMSPFYPVYQTDENKTMALYYSELEKYNPKCKKECEGITIPLLGAAAYALYEGIPMNKLYEKWGHSRLMLNFRVPVERTIHAGQGMKKPESLISVYRHISIADILENKLSAEEKAAINGGVVVVGATAAGAFDHFPSPFQELAPGAEFHANIIDNLIHDDYLRPVNFLFKILLLLISIWLPILLIKRSTTGITLYTAAYAVFMAFLSLFSLKFHKDISFSTYFVAVSVSYAYVMAYKSIVEGKEKKWIKNTFSQYLSPKVVNVLTEDPSKLRLGGEKRDMTVFFMDIAHFTTISEKMSPEELTRFLNVYLSALTDIILKYDGVVDKYIGDCIMAFWNAPLDLKNHRTMGCLAAVECINKIKEINKTSEFSAKPSMRIGMNSGSAVVGNMGSNLRFSYTAIGDTVNLASRLEGANKFFSSSIMISEDVYKEAAAKVEARFLGRIKVVGKDIPVEVYEPLAIKGAISEETASLLKAYEKGLAYFKERKYREAEEAFGEALKVVAEDGPSRFYKEISGKFLSEGDGGFSGVFNLTSK